MGWFAPGNFLPFKELRLFKVAIGRDFVDDEHWDVLFFTRNLHKKADMTTAGADAALMQLQTFVSQSRSVSTEKYKNF